MEPHGAEVERVIEPSRGYTVGVALDNTPIHHHRYSRSTTHRAKYRHQLHHRVPTDLLERWVIATAMGTPRHTSSILALPALRHVHPTLTFSQSSHAATSNP